MASGSSGEPPCAAAGRWARRAAYLGRWARATLRRPLEAGPERPAYGPERPTGGSMAPRTIGGERPHAPTSAALFPSFSLIPTVPPLPRSDAVVDPRIGDLGPAVLALEDGTIFRGFAFGAPVARGGALVVNTTQ